MTDISDPHFAERVRESFDRQNVMHLIRATLPVIEHGRTEIHLPHWEGIEQQHGFVHGGIVGTIADSAAGYAAMTVVPASASVLTVEYKLNLVAPADGQKLIARGQIVRPGPLRVNFERLQVVGKRVFRVVVRLALTGTRCTSW